jgi:putative CocE/NonD family hydrolase
MTFFHGYFGSDIPAGETSKQKGDVDLLWGVKVPMRDGILLNATVYKPGKMAEPQPVIIGLTPYTADSYHERAMFFARNGYVFAAVDCRGRGNSGGVFEPIVNEGKDGHDLVEWFARQPYCSGKVTMSGGSYGGFDQWATLREFPAHLSTIIPTASGYPSFDFPFPNNIFMTYFISWLTLTSGKPSNFNLFGESAFWAQKYYELYKGHRPLRELDEVSGNTSTFFQTWMDRAIPGAYWDVALPQEEHYRKIDIPILTITGHYDGDQKGALGYYREHMRFGQPEAVREHYLVIGPWDHGGTAKPRKEVGGVKFGDASLLDMLQLHKQWYDWIMKDGEKPDFLKKRVAYYVMDAEEWKYADSLEEVGRETRTLYLTSSAGKANDVFESGALAVEKPNDAKADSYVYDPLDTRPGELEVKIADSFYNDYLTNQTFALNLFGNGLLYHSQPFEEDLEVSGFVKLSVWIELDVPDTDFEVELYEILADSSSILLTGDMKRARYRDSLREEKLVPQGEIIRYDFEGFTFFSRHIRKGSRLRLVFKCVNSISWEKNYNSGGVVNQESGKDARTAHVKLYHDANHPSSLEIPVIK